MYIYICTFKFYKRSWVVKILTLEPFNQLLQRVHIGHDSVQLCGANSGTVNCRYRYSYNDQERMSAFVGSGTVASLRAVLPI